MKTEENIFWNSPSIVNTFADLPPPEYWKSFFEGIGQKPRFKVLDLGCGGGRITEMLAVLGFDTWAIDSHESMVERTRSRLGVVLGKDSARDKVRLSPMSLLPFDDSFFDAVVANGVYHNALSLGEIDAAFSETARVIRPGGSLCLNMFYEGPALQGLRELDRNERLFITKENTRMVLLPKDDVFKRLAAQGFSPEGKILEYTSGVLTGERSVLRGIFKKGDP